jgi:hypothetical protein
MTVRDSGIRKQGSELRVQKSGLGLGLRVRVEGLTYQDRITHDVEGNLATKRFWNRLPCTRLANAIIHLKHLLAV